MSKMKVLFVPYHIGGHTQAVIGLAEEMSKRGHEVIFAVDKCREKLLIRNQFDVELINVSRLSNEKLNSQLMNLTSSNYFAERLIKLVIDINWLDKLKSIINTPDISKQLKNVLETVKPDVFVTDGMFSPALYNSGMPWVTFWSANPLYIEEPKNVLPLGLGENWINYFYSFI